MNFLKKAKRERRDNEYNNDFTEFELLMGYLIFSNLVIQGYMSTAQETD